MSCTPEHSIRKWIISRQASTVFLALALLAVLGLSLNPRPQSIFGRMNVYDKAGHFAAYIVLGFLAMRAIGRRGALPLAVVVASCAALGGLIEVIQPLVGRNMELGDFFVDLGGSVIGAVGAALLLRRARRRPGTGQVGKMDH